MLTSGHPGRRVLLALLAVGLTAGGLSAVQPRASAAPPSGLLGQISSVVHGIGGND